MFKTLNADKPFIERKFHNPDEPFNAFCRMAYHGEGYDFETGLDDEGLLEGLKNLQKEIKDLPHPVARAKATKYVLENERLYVNEHDYFIGLYSLNRLANSVTFKVWEQESLKLRKQDLVEKSNDFNQSGAVMIWTDYDHVIPDWDSLLNLGFTGVLERAMGFKNKHIEEGTLTDEMRAFYDAIEIEYNAIISLIDRLEKHALTKTHDKAKAIAKCLNTIKNGAPTNIYEAMQLMWIYFLISECIDAYQVRSLGNGLDNTLISFYKNDIANGTYTREEIREFLGYFMLQWSSIGNYWGQPLYLGGSRLDGSSKINDLSHDIIEVHDVLDIYNPKIQIKVNSNIPQDFLDKVLEMVARKNASFVFCGEPAHISAVMHYGATYEEALEYDIRGCYETGIKAKEVCPSSGYINASKAVEYTLTQGYDYVINKQVGVKTKALNELETFNDFYEEFLKQWSYLIEKTIEIAIDAERFLSYVNPSTMYSSSILKSVQNGADGYQGCVKYSTSALLNCSFASAVDSVMAIYDFVYNKKEMSLDDMADAVKNNWEGHEIERLKILKSPHKYGNGDELTDTFAKGMSDFYTSKVNNTRNGRGGLYKAIMHSARAFISQGEKTLASPNGRKAFEELSKNASPAPGMDKNGVTALISSALKLVPSTYTESFCLDVVLHPTTVQGDDGINVLRSLLMHYVKNGGMSMQFNIFNKETLIDAQLHPEKYKNLQVRVCGWNTLWNNMSKAEQDAYIVRACNVG